MSPKDVDAELEKIRKQRLADVEQQLYDDMRRLAPGNAAYWVAVVGGAFLLNLLLIILLSGG